MSYPSLLLNPGLRKRADQRGCSVKTVLLFACLFSTVLLAACSNRTELSESVNNLRFKTLSGDEISLQETQTPVLINFWSTSCVICLREMPELAEMYHEYSPRGFELVAVAMPYDAPNEVLELATARQLPFPVALDITGEAVDAFESVKGTPTSYLLDQDGKLVRRYVGAIDLKDLRSQLDQLLDIS